MSFEPHVTSPVAIRHSHCANVIYIHTNTAHTYRVISRKSVRVGLAHRTSGPASPATRFGSVSSRVAAVLLGGLTVSRGAYQPIKLALVLCGVWPPRQLGLHL